MTRFAARPLQALVALTVTAVAIVWLSGGFEHRIPPGEVPVPTTPVPAGSRIAVVEQRDDPVAEWSSGTLASARQTVVASRILGRIDEIRVRAGEPVAAGDILAVFQSQELRAGAEQAREALQAARARLDLARSELERYESLHAKGVATTQRLDQARAELRTADANAKGEEQRVREAETALSYTEIRAPVSGVVVDRLAEPGETVSPGEPLLRIYDPSALRVEVPVRETLAVRLQVGDTLDVEVPAANASFQARIAEIVPFAEPGARTLLVKAALPANPNLFAGLFARVAVPAGSRSRLLIPADAVERIGQLDYVSVIDGTQRLQRRLVTLGDYREGDLTEVLSGLAAGERVVTPAKPSP